MSSSDEESHFNGFNWAEEDEGFRESLHFRWSFSDLRAGYSSLDRPTREQLKSTEQWTIFSLDDSRPLCRTCGSLDFADLISFDGVLHQSKALALKQQYDSPSGCPLCSEFWGALINYLKRIYSQDYSEESPYDQFKSKDDRLEALKEDPVRIFLNPLMQDRPQDRTHLPYQYQLREFSVWSASSDILDRIQLRGDLYGKEATYHAPDLMRSIRMLMPQTPRSGEFLRRNRALTTAELYPITSWCDPVAKHVRYKSIIPDMNDPKVIDMIKTWIESCTNEHEHCRSLPPMQLPSRLIDIGEESTQTPRLIVADDIKRLEETEGRQIQYIALSYCWGAKKDIDQVPFFSTTSKTLDTHIKALPTNRLPKTICDAMDLTRKLGFRYLWADSLCIIQGHNAEAHEDWSKESAKMASIYGGAYLTIAASWGHSMHSGLFTQRPSETPDGVMLGLKSLRDPSCYGTIQLIQDRSQYTESTEEPLYRRGWALQERILSPRILICNRDQLVWECQTHSFTESGTRMSSIGAMRLDHAFLSQVTPRENASEDTDQPENAAAQAKVFRDIWQCIVTDYCHKSITNATDKLPAIAGLAKRLAELSPSPNVYLAGLWKNSILEDLLWVHEDIDSYSLQKESVLNPRHKPESYRAPSWSWACVDGGVRWPHVLGHHRHATLVTYGVTPRYNHDVFGELSAGYIELKAPLWKVPDDLKQLVVKQEPTEKITGSRYEMAEPYTWLWKPSVDVRGRGLSYLNAVGESKVNAIDFSLLIIDETMALIVSSAKDQDSSEKYYERVGVVTYWDRGRVGDENCQETICKLI
ncbi:heterokaryon incompatibility protein-domain-containing protein [Lophiotrema nucula]|uniref:Heterokaryon incompatibility protein-domain-containing protein n=1 Tax=Lophiotrema nucula TaxID=690887 RepID=A0A6A5YIV1_9PLEO|nr:heterokaryon incompatibility protein-domain-containing protein [Lophiotrema nucula]